MEKREISLQTCVGRRWCRFLDNEKGKYFCARNIDPLPNELKELSPDEVFTPQKPRFECQKEIETD